MLTSFGSLSRNRTCGLRIGKGEKLKDIIATSKGVVEGVPTIQVVAKYAKEHNIFMPIVFVINDFLNGTINL
jgi:glycerol-3-phosphate dehydrogenase (NAD+)